MLDINSLLTSTNIPQKTSSNTNNQFDKDTFLQVLVAQMKYQNPIEPSSDTEYISQYATFSQVEQLCNIQNVVNALRADMSLGKTVKINVPGLESENEIIGKVDKVFYLDDTAYISVCGNNYLFESVKEILNNDSEA